MNINSSRALGCSHGIDLGTLAVDVGLAYNSNKAFEIHLVKAVRHTSSISGGRIAPSVSAN